MMTPGTRARLERIAEVFSGRSDLGFENVGDLENLMRHELGSLDALENWMPAGSVRLKAIAPQKIYHVLASNLAVSAETSLVLGLMLGSELVFKLPGVGLAEFESTMEKLPPDLRAAVKLVRVLDEAEMRDSDAVVVFGSNETVDFFRKKIRRDQRTAFYGHRISFGVLEKGVGDWALWAGKAAEEVAVYDQQGCLSPQFYIAANEEEAQAFAEFLAEALQRRILPAREPGLSFEDLSQRRHARRVLRGRGEKIWESDEGTGFTVALLSHAEFFVGPGYRFIQVGFSSEPTIALRGWKGQVSSISLASSDWPSMSGEWEELARELGASRLCRIGDLQKPSLSWQHDGRPQLGDLVTWMTLDV